MAAAYAETGDFQAAVQWSEKALESVKDTDSAEFRAALQRSLESYEAKRHNAMVPASDESDDGSPIR